MQCLNFRFEDTPEGKYTETIFAAQGELERDQNRRQVLQKMKARMEKGYSVFHAPIGDSYGGDPVHSKLLMRDEPIASIIAEELEGFAAGRIASLTEVKRFFESYPEFPRSKVTGEVRITKVRVTYAGYVQAPDWDVSLRKGHHAPLISLGTHQRIQDRIAGISVALARKGINHDLPMRGFVLCDNCGEPMTSCRSKGRKKHYAYNLCDTRDCESKLKSVPRAAIEEGAEAILQAVQPSKGMAAVAKAMLTDLWDKRLSEAKSAQKAIRKQLTDIDVQIETTLDRLLETTNASVVRAYEARVENA